MPPAGRRCLRESTRDLGIVCGRQAIVAPENADGVIAPPECHGAEQTSCPGGLCVTRGCLGTTIRGTNVDFNQGAFAFYALRRLSPAADVTFGLRVNTLQGALTLTGPDITRSEDKTWVDPIAGITIRTPAKHHVQLRLYTEVGGFGAGSDFAWQVFPDLSINLTRKASLEFGYRWLDRTTRQVRAAISSGTTC
jgi:hypothetical protein